MKFSLTKNKLYRKETDPPYVACTHISGRVTTKQVIERLCYISTLTEGDVMAVLTSLDRVITEFIRMGHSVDLSPFFISFSIKGGFSSPTDNFQAGRNWIEIKTRVKKSFRRAVNDGIKPQRIVSSGTLPLPISLTNIFGEKSFSEFQPGEHIRIWGKFLDFDISDMETGVFMQSESGEQIRVNQYAKISKTNIIFLPAANLKPGSYEIEVRSRMRSGKIAKGLLRDSLVLGNKNNPNL